MRPARLSLVIAFVALAVDFAPRFGECCQTAKTIYRLISDFGAAPSRVEPIDGWKEVPLPPCEFWVCGNPPGHRWTLKETEGQVEVEWHARNDDLDASALEIARSVILPEAGYDLVSAPGERTVRVSTSAGKLDVPRAAFEHEVEDGYFFVAEPYTCSPTKLLFYPKSDEVGREVPADNIRKIIELDGSLWGISGYPTVPEGELVQITRGSDGTWTTRKVDAFKSFPLVLVKLDDERALVATSSSIELIDCGEVTPLVIEFPGGSIEPESIARDADGVVYIAVRQGVLRIDGIDDLFGPELTLLVPDDSYLELPASCGSIECAPVRGWLERNWGKELRSPWAWVAGAWYILTAALGVWLLVRWRRKK